MILSLAVRGVLGPRPRRFAIRVAGLLVMVAAAVYAGAVLAPRIARAQRRSARRRRRSPDATRGASSSAACTACRCRCSWFPLLGGLALLFFELKD